MIDKNSFPVINDNEILKTALDKMNYFGYGIVCDQHWKQIGWYNYRWWY